MRNGSAHIADRRARNVRNALSIRGRMSGDVSNSNCKEWWSGRLARCGVDTVVSSTRKRRSNSMYVVCMETSVFW